MMTGLVHDQNLEKQIEKQIGCMSGFLQIFERHQVLTGKRLYAAKRLPPTAGVDSTSESEMSVGLPAISRELQKPRPMTPISPDRSKTSVPPSSLPSPFSEKTPAVIPAKTPHPLPVFELKEGTRSSWKFCKEAPRLSLDSRATVDAKGGLYPREIRTNAAILSANRSDTSSGDGDGGDNHLRSPSVIARLMGLEPLPPNSDPEPPKKAELRRSSSESRVSRDLFQSRFIDTNNFPQKQTNISDSPKNATKSNLRLADPTDHSSKYTNSVPAKGSHRAGARSESPWKPNHHHQQRKSFFDSEDFFPEPKQTVSIYGEIEKRLKMRGIDEPSKDLDTLKQILEALQLKGLLHSKRPTTTEHITRKNFVYDRNFSFDESSIVVIKPSKSPSSPINRRFGNESPPSSFRCRTGARRNANANLTGEKSPSVSPQRNRPNRNQQRGRNSCSPTRSESNAKGSNSNSNSPLRRKPLNVETPRRSNGVSQIHSPKVSPRRSVSDQTNTTQSPRNKKSMAEIHPKQKLSIVTEDEESSSVSETSIDTERSKMEEYKEGRNLLERCDKLLHSIAEMTATELQPSPVSVLDSSFYKDESSSSPSPVMKRSIDFKEQAGEWEEELWSPAISPVGSKSGEKSNDCDFLYILEILRASNYLPEDADVFLLVEKQQYLKGNDTSKVSKLQRRLIFDTVTEIVERNKQLPPWKPLSWTNSGSGKPSLNQIWSEFQRIRERDTAEELFEIICGVLRKDLVSDGANGWGDCPVEMSEAVLDIERLIFKDLVGETIRDLATFAGKSMPRRKLVF